LTGAVGLASLTGISFAAPYTVAEELNTTRRTPWAVIAANSEADPHTLLA
jgi:hypothetical protein